MKDLDGLATLDVQRREVLECPYPYYARLRESRPVFRTARGYWLVTGYDECCAVLQDTVRFSGNLPSPHDPQLEAILASGYPEVPTLLAADPPEHGQYRGLVNKAFLPSRVTQLEPEIKAIAEGLIDQFIGDECVDLVEQFAVGLPLTLIGDAGPQHDTNTKAIFHDAAQLPQLLDRSAYPPRAGRVRKPSSVSAGANQCCVRTAADPDRGATRPPGGG